VGIANETHLRDNDPAAVHSPSDVCQLIALAAGTFAAYIGSIGQRAFLKDSTTLPQSTQNGSEKWLH
jgi:hypothetical protein